MKYTQKLDLNLHHLWLTLHDLQSQNYDDIIEKKINELISFVESILFENIDSDYDIVDTECLYTVYLEKFNTR